MKSVKVGTIFSAFYRYSWIVVLHILTILVRGIILACICNLNGNILFIKIRMKCSAGHHNFHLYLKVLVFDIFFKLEHYLMFLFLKIIIIIIIIFYYYYYYYY